MCELCEIEMARGEHVCMELVTPDDPFAATTRLRHDGRGEIWEIEVLDCYDATMPVHFPVTHCPWCGRDLRDG